MRSTRFFFELDEGLVELLYHPGYPARRFGHPDQQHPGEADSVEILVAPSEAILYAKPGSPVYERLLDEARSRYGARPAFG